jgi:hypothetical protein
MPVADKDYNYEIDAQDLQPQMARKEHLDRLRLIYDFTPYLDTGEVISRIIRATVQTVPPGASVPSAWTNSANWRQDYPLECPMSLATVPPGSLPEDTYPLVVVAQALTADGKGVDIWVDDGTPGFTYVMSFLAVALMSNREKQVDTLITIEVPINSLMVGPMTAAAPGDYVTGTGAVLPLTDSTAANIASITLGAGDWIVNGSVSFNTGTALIYRLAAGASSLTGVLPAKPLYTQLAFGGAVSGAEWGLVIPEQRFYLSDVTTVYLVVNAGFSPGAAVTAIGRLSARNWAGVV